MEVIGLQLTLFQREKNETDESDILISEDSDVDTLSQNYCVSKSLEDDDIDIATSITSCPQYFDAEEAEGDWQGIDLQFATNKPLKQVSLSKNLE